MLTFCIKKHFLRHTLKYKMTKNLKKNHKILNLYYEIGYYIKERVFCILIGIA